MCNTCKGEPNNAVEGEDCVHLEAKPEYDILPSDGWNDNNCREYYGAICQENIQIVYLFNMHGY